MRGIVIWHSKIDFKAIIWCEDSQELAIAAGATAWRNPMLPFSVGDWVGFSSKLGADNMRQCRDIYLIESQVAPGLPVSLMNRKQQVCAPRKNTHLHLCSSRD